MQLVVLLGLLGILEVRFVAPLIARVIVSNFEILYRDCDGPFTRGFR
jgi:hypothetical protein